MIDPRKTKVESDYQTGPKKRMKCEICTNFVYPDMCKAIKGAVTQTGWCKLYSSKRQQSAA